MGNVEGVYE